jgi:hypothetical protein
MTDADAADAAWRRCAFAFLGAFAVALLCVVAVIVLVDPYDSGRFFNLVPPGISDESPRTANASRGRDPNFDSAIFGNSYSQLLDPRRLQAMTGLRFVQMTVPGSGPREVDALLHWFAGHHSKVGAVIIGVDEQWCRHDASMSLTNPFPFWLYGGTRAFLASHLHSRVIALAARRLRVAAGWLSATDPAGYWDYEQGREWNFKDSAAGFPPVDLSPPPSVTDQKFPVVDVLMDGLAVLPKETVVTVLMPPQFRSALPNPGTEAASDIAACKRRIIARLAERPHSVFLDFFLDTPESRDPANFMDQGHYRAALARMIERKIATAIDASAK